MTTELDTITYLDTTTIYDVIQKQQLIKLKKQIAKRDALLNEVKVYVWGGFDSRAGMIDIKWNNFSDAVVLDRYYKYY